MPDQMSVTINNHQQPVKTFLALGDSYTIGSGVERYESWPFQLSDALIQRGILMD